MKDFLRAHGVLIIIFSSFVLIAMCETVERIALAYAPNHRPTTQIYR
jgi:hypothetical protein